MLKFHWNQPGKRLAAAGLILATLLASQMAAGGRWMPQAEAQGSVPTRGPSATPTEAAGPGGGDEPTDTPIPPVPSATQTTAPTQPGVTSTEPLVEISATASAAPETPAATIGAEPTATAAPATAVPSGEGGGGTPLGWAIGGMAAVGIALALFAFWRRRRSIGG